MEDKDWKLKLRYGKQTTPYKHNTLIAQGVSEQKIEGYDNLPGPAYMGIAVWAPNDEDAVEILVEVGKNLGFKVTGNIEIYETDPKEPPKDNPSYYQVNFTSYE